MSLRFFASDKYSIATSAEANMQVLQQLLTRGFYGILVITSSDATDQKILALATLIGGGTKLGCSASHDARFFVFGAAAWQFLAQFSCNSCEEMVELLKMTRLFPVAVLYEEPTCTLLTRTLIA